MKNDFHKYPQQNLCDTVPSQLIRFIDSIQTKNIEGYEFSSWLDP